MVLLMGYGVEIAVCGKNGGSRMVEATQSFRKAGLTKDIWLLKVMVNLPTV